MRLVCFVSFSFATCMGFEQHAALDIATASSTRFAGNLVGSPAFNVSRRRVVALDIGWLWRSDRNFQPLACLLPEVFKQRSCHVPTFNMDRTAPFSSHHCLTADSLFVAHIVL